MHPTLRSPYLPGSLVFIVFIFGFTILNLLTPARAVSTYERRTLSQRPQLTVENVISGRFMQDYASHMQDQAALRDPLRFLKSSVERGVFRKVENNGVYVVGDRVDDKFYGVRQQLTATAAQRMNEIIASLPEPNAFLSMIPTKAQGLLGDDRYLLSDQRQISDALRGTVKAAYLDLMDLASTDREARYYGADPHWTSQGAIKAYEIIARGLGLQPITDYSFDTLSDSYVGSEYGKAAARNVPLDTIQLAHNEILDGMTICREETRDRVICHESVYVPPTPTTVDLYDVYLGGLAPIIVITNDNAPNDDELIIFKDSYAHAIAPFLAQHYRKVTLVDLRYVQRQYVLDHVNFEDATVLFLYSTSVINTDPRALN
jgi:hypothetical protein